MQVNKLIDNSMSFIIMLKILSKRWLILLRFPGMFKIQLIILLTMIVDYRFFVGGLKW